MYVATGNNYKVPPEYTECQLDRSTSVDECGLPANYVSSPYSFHGLTHNLFHLPSLAHCDVCQQMQTASPYLNDCESLQKRLELETARQRQAGQVKAQHPHKSKHGLLTNQPRHPHKSKSSALTSSSLLACLALAVDPRKALVCPPSQPGKIYGKIMQVY